MKKIYMLALVLLFAGCAKYDNPDFATDDYYSSDSATEQTASNSSSLLPDEEAPYSYTETTTIETTEIVNVAGMHDSVMNAPLTNYKVGNPYNLDNNTYTPYEDYTYKAEGMASWYGNEFAGQKTANGETFNNSYFTAAHKTLPMPSVAKVTNLENGKSTYVRINDRGPFTKSRLIDVSEAAAQELGFKEKGSAQVRVEILPAESVILKNKALANAPVEPATNLVDAAPVAAAPVATTAAVETIKQTPTGTFEVQAGALGSKENAEALGTRLSTIGDVRIISDGDFFKVRFGPYASKEEALKVRSQLINMGVNPGLINNGKWASWD